MSDSNRGSGLHSYAVALAVLAWALVITGAAVTSSHNHGAPVRFETLHRAVSIAVGILTAGLLVWLHRADNRAWLMRLSEIVFAVEVIEGWIGMPNSSGTLGPVIGTLHACIAALLFAALASVALFTSSTWRLDPEIVQDYGWPSLRSLSVTSALLVAVQVGFGAGFRHSAVGVMPHLLGALVVALFIMIVGAFTTNQFPKHRTLRPIAIWLIVITSIQVFLGMAAFLMLMMDRTASSTFLAISVAHVATGNLTFALSVILAIQVRRDVRPRSQAT